MVFESPCKKPQASLKPLLASLAWVLMKPLTFAWAFKYTIKPVKTHNCYSDMNVEVF